MRNLLFSTEKETAMKLKLIKVKDLAHLKKLTDGQLSEFRMQLNGGVFSRKWISYDRENKNFHIENCIDGSRQVLTETRLMDSRITLIGEAITKGALWLENRWTGN